MKTESERIYEEHAELLNKALDLFNQGKLKEAKAVFNKLKNGKVLEFQHKAEVYLQIIEKLSSRKKNKKEDPLDKAVRLINEKEPEAALQALEGLDEGDARVWYLRSIALTLLDRVDEAAEALKKAVSLDRRFFYLARKEPDLFPLWDTGKLDDF